MTILFNISNITAASDAGKCHYFINCLAALESLFEYFLVLKIMCSVIMNAPYKFNESLRIRKLIFDAYEQTKDRISKQAKTESWENKYEVSRNRLIIKVHKIEANTKEGKSI